MDISKLTLKTLKTIVKNSLEQADQNGHSSFNHLRITYSWLRYETDEDLFEILKNGPGKEYIESLLPIEKEENNEHIINSKSKDYGSECIRRSS